MRRLIVSLGLALTALAVMAGGVGATHSSGQGPRQDLSTGTGIRTALVGPLPSETRVSMHVNAHSGPLGEEARGHFFVKRQTSPPVAGRPDLDFSGRVTCLTVVGNRATVGGVITQDRLMLDPLEPLEGKGYLGIYVDNDQGDGDAPDESNSVFGPPFVPTPPGEVCPPFPVGSAPFQQGNYIVHNAMP